MTGSIHMLHENMLYENMLRENMFLVREFLLFLLSLALATPKKER